MSARRAVLVLLVLAAVHAVTAENFYELLGVSEEADSSQIKRAYRKLSLKYHPDKNRDNPDAEAKFQAIARAYEVLSDEEKRQVYDMEGEEGLENLEKGGNRPASPFDMFFGGGGGGRRRGPNAHVSTQVSLEDLYNGGERSARIKRNVICRKCKGTGAKDGATKKCSACGGKGVRLVQQQMAPGFNVQMQQTCEKCGGKGQVFKTKCPYCKGKKVVPEEKELTATIERGMPSDHEIVFERQSEQAPGITPGDVVFKLHQAPHPRFKREGNDLHHTMHISLREALLGFKKPIRHLDGRDVEVASKGVTKPFEVRTVEGEGMPVHNFPSQKGDLYVKYHVDFPKKLSDSQKALVEELFSS